MIHGSCLAGLLGLVGGSLTSRMVPTCSPLVVAYHRYLLLLGLVGCSLTTRMVPEHTW